MRACPACGTEASPDPRFCASCGAPLTAPGTAVEERKLVTILFADVISSTQLGDQLDPEAVRGLLRDYFDAMSNVIAASALVQRAREMAPAMALLAPITDRVEAELIAARDGDRERPIELLRSARDGYEQMGAPYEAAIAGELLAELEPPDAAAVREAAHASFRSLGVVRSSTG